MNCIMLLYPGCIAWELLLAAELLNARIPTFVATPDGRDHVATNGITFRADAAWRDVEIEQAQVVLIPGGDPGGVLQNREIDALLVAADARGATLAAICAGPLLLAKAGLLQPCDARSARRFTHGYSAKEMPYVGKYFVGACFVDEPVVVDGNIITAKADAYIDFAIETALRTGALERPDTTPEERGAFLRRYYRGQK